MSLRKGFLQTEIFSIPKKKFIGAFFIAVAFACAFYAFLYMSREVFRALSVTKYHDIWLLTDAEVAFYNLFYAFLSSVLAFNMLVTYLFSAPKRYFERKYYRRVSVVNDQRFLMQSFVFWFAKTASLYGVLYGYVFWSWNDETSLYLNYKYLFVFIIIALFLHSFITLSRYTRGKRVKWMFISALVISLNSVLLAQINFVHYKSMNELILSKNVYAKHKIELPHCKTYQRIYSPQNYLQICITSKQDSSGFSVIFGENEVDVKLLDDSLSQIENKNEQFYLGCMLTVDNRVKLQNVIEVQNILWKNGFGHSPFAVYPQEWNIEMRGYQPHAAKIGLANYIEVADYQEWCKNIQNDSNLVMNMRQDDNGNCYLDDTLVSMKHLKDELKNKIVRDTSYLLKYHINRNITFNEFAQVCDAYCSAIDELRETFIPIENSKYLYLNGYELEERASEHYPYSLVYCLDVTPLDKLKPPLSNKPNAHRSREQ